MSTIILGISIILQFVAAILSVRLIKVTGRKIAWILIAIAMSFMGIRRLVTLYRSISSDIPYSADLTAELVALSISILMVLGVMLIGPIFKKNQLINKALYLSEEKYKNMANMLPQPIYEANMQGNITFVNQAGFISFATKFDDVYEKVNVIDFIIPEDRERAKKNIQTIIQGKKLEANEYTILKKDGGRFPALIYSAPIFDADKVVGTRGVVTDLTKLKQAQDSVRRFSHIFEDSLNEIYQFDKDTLKFVQANNAALDNLGYTMEEIQELTPLDIKPQFTSELFAELIAPLRNGEKTKIVFETVHQRKDKSLYDVEVHLQLIEHNQETLFTAIILDISDRKRADEELTYQASHDALTGLVNRREFERRAERLLSVVQHDKSVHALCYLDLDQFKVVNDTSGHIAGDEMLRQLSSLLKETVRHRDTLARLGGDEFSVLMEHCSLDDAHRVATTLLKAIQNYQFSWEDQSFKVGVSMGLVPITDSTINLTELLKEADAACYMAKEKGRNRIHVYHPEDSGIAQRHGEMQWVTRINKALEENRFCLYAQAIVPLDASTDIHYELLLRMVDEKGTIIPPAAFLPAAERYNIISKIDRWVVENVFGILAKNPGFLKQIDFISINLSGQSLADEDFLYFVIKQLQALDTNSAKVCFEITETAAISNLSQAMKFINRLKSLGCQFALDDFGSGMSSFAYLKNLPVDYLKIDGMFVKDIVDDPIDRAMVKSINEIGQVMGMQTIAEFVENDEIKDMLREIGVNYAQGYGTGKPQPFSKLLDR